MDDLTRGWGAWHALPYPESQYPPGSDVGEVAGVDLALLDGDVGMIVGKYIRRRGLDAESRSMLPVALDDLEKVVPLLAEPGRTYFSAALELLRAVRDAAALRSARKNPVVTSHAHPVRGIRGWIDRMASEPWSTSVKGVCRWFRTRRNRG